jgi:hypothetical protein
MNIMSKSERVEGDQLQITEVSYQSGDAEVKGRIYNLTSMAKAFPGIVVLPGRGRDFRGMEWLLKALALNGYVAIAIGYRGLATRYYFTDVEDALNAISHLETLSYCGRVANWDFWTLPGRHGSSNVCCLW